MNRIWRGAKKVKNNKGQLKNGSGDCSRSDWLSGFTGEDLVLKPDLDQVPALAAERDAQWARVANADFLTDAEKRALLGLPALAETADG